MLWGCEGIAHSFLNTAVDGMISNNAPAVVPLGSESLVPFGWSHGSLRRFGRQKCLLTMLKTEPHVKWGNVSLVLFI